MFCLQLICKCANKNHIRSQNTASLLMSAVIGSLCCYLWGKYVPISGLEKEDSGLRSETFVFICKMIVWVCSYQIQVIGKNSCEMLD